MSLLSLHRCEASYNITPSCTLDPPFNSSGSQYNVIGEFHRGEATFEGNPDVAGVGVLLAFLGVTAIAVTTGWLNIGCQFCGRIVTPWLLVYDSSTQVPERFTNIGKWQSSKLKALLDDMSKLSHGLVLQCSDQQTITGILFACTLRSAHGCDLSIYHFTIIVDSLLVACLTFTLAVALVTNFWKKKLLAFLRLVGGVVLFILTGYALLPSTLPSFPKATDNDLLILPVSCLVNNTAWGPASSWYTIYIATIIVSAVSVLLDLGGLALPNLMPGQEDRLNWRESRKEGGSHRFFITGSIYFLCTFGFGAGSLIWLTVQISHLRSWLNGSGWLDMDNNGMNPENDVFAIGQALPAVLFFLPLISALSVFGPLLKLSKVVCPGVILLFELSIIIAWCIVFRRRELLEPYVKKQSGRSTDDVALTSLLPHPP